VHGAHQDRACRAQQVGATVAIFIRRTGGSTNAAPSRQRGDRIALSCAVHESLVGPSRHFAAAISSILERSGHRLAGKIDRFGRE
jgi:hypothetical protein